MKKAQELRDMAISELELAIEDANKEVFALLNQAKREKKMSQPHLLKLVKKYRARLLTILSEKKTQTV